MSARLVDPPERPPTRSEIEYGCAVEAYKRRKGMSLPAGLLAALLLLAVLLLPAAWWS
jgi:uncharacterized protein involved in exopolysaccharide biosynthesis